MDQDNRNYATERMQRVTSEALTQTYGVLQRDVLPDGNQTGLLPDCKPLGQRERRNLVRSVFAFFEGVTFWLKMTAVAFDEKGLTPAEMDLCLEPERQNYGLNKKGEPTERTDRMKLDTLHNVRFAFLVFAKAHGLAFKLDCSREGWKAINDTQEVRDRLMHPRSPAGLDVEDPEIDQAQAAFNWFHAQAQAVLTEGAEAVRRRAEER
jgi:hypothetical protein